ncbi:hypothetical protein BDW71DRAFT_203563 [Aspergillus fruticulosus]
MDIPNECTVLIVGGGPGGSYTASVLAREGIYHIGESLLPSTREFLQFIDAYDKFEAHGFRHKNGASFSYNSKPAAYTNFLAFGGHAWNAIRSESDHLLFEHAKTCGARVYDQTKVDCIEFRSISGLNGHGGSGSPSNPAINLGRPFSASWSRKDKTSGSIKFEYLIDASGRAGLVSTKYMKNRKFNKGLKNLATWGYFKNAGVYGEGTPVAGSPFFPRLEDGSGWAWFIPLHNGTTSVGVVMEQSSFTAKEKAMKNPSSRGFLLEHIKHAPGIADLLVNATLVSEVKSATDWSYSASTYAAPYIRIVGDAGCFIDPLFSSGVHLALTGALSAAASICAVLKGDCTEETAAGWHSEKIREAYTRFLLVVTSAYAQIREQERPVLNEYVEKNFDRAFSFFRPIIQRTIEAAGTKLTREEVTQSVDFCMQVIRKVSGAVDGQTSGMEDHYGEQTCDRIKKAELKAGLDNFSADAVLGMTVNLQRGALGLVKVA